MTAFRISAWGWESRLALARFLWVLPCTRGSGCRRSGERRYSPERFAIFLVVALAYGLTHLISGRAAYIHIGALFGTIMAANVWMRILPATRKMLNAIREGKPVDLKLAERAKGRTIHNTYMTVPLIFLMISNHFPTATYGANYNWLILSALVLAGGISAKFIYKAS